MPTSAGDAAKLARSNGQAPNGEVTIEDFDRGVVETLGAVIREFPRLEGRAVRSLPDEAYFLIIDTVRPPPGLPGVPVYFGDGEDVAERTLVPYVLVKPAGLTPAMHRFHPTTAEYRAPAPTARMVGASGRLGADRFVEKQQAHPFDISYTIDVIAKRRTTARSRERGASPLPETVEGGSGNSLLQWVLQVYPAYCGVNVLDTAGDYRVYSAFMEGVTRLDQATEVGDRVVGFSLTLRVEGELDLDPPREFRAVRQLTVRSRVR